MKYKVTWFPPAEERLAEMWMGSRVAHQITLAADRLDVTLAQDPLAVGESRGQDLRIAFESPLAITYLVDQQAKEVVILHVWMIR